MLCVSSRTVRIRQLQKGSNLYYLIVVQVTGSSLKQTTVKTWNGKRQRQLTKGHLLRSVAPSRICLRSSLGTTHTNGHGPMWLLRYHEQEIAEASFATFDLPSA